MAVYNGLIGKLSTSIFSGSGRGSAGAMRYAAIGAGGGAVAGALSSDDGYTVGAMRGAAFGALGGVGVNMLPKYISSTYKSSGFTSWDHGLNKGIANEAESIFRSTYDGANTDTTRALLKDFVPKAKQAWKKPTDREFSIDVTNSLIDGMKNFDKAGMDNLTDLGQGVEKNIETFKASGSYKVMKDYFDVNKGSFDKMSFGQKANMVNAMGIKGGFDSAYHHIVAPTGDLIKNLKSGNMKNITKGQMAAGAFSVYGAFEAKEIIDDVSNGDYSGALGGMGKLVAGKLAFSQAGNLIKANSFLKEKGMTWSGLGRSVGGGVAAKRFFSGTQAFSDADNVAMAAKFASATGRTF